jgi:hypothetical protein
MDGLERASGNMHTTRFFEFLDKIEEMIFADGLAQITAWILFIGGIIAWPITAKTMFKHEPARYSRIELSSYYLHWVPNPSIYA